MQSQSKGGEASVGKKKGRLKSTVPGRRGLRGRGGRRSRKEEDGGAAGGQSDAMSSDCASSTDATESNEKVLAQGMMNLAIVCSHQQEQSTKDVAAAGNIG